MADRSSRDTTRHMTVGAIRREDLDRVSSVRSKGQGPSPDAVEGRDRGRRAGEADTPQLAEMKVALQQAELAVTSLGSSATGRRLERLLAVVRRSLRAAKQSIPPRQLALLRRMVGDILHEASYAASGASE